MTQPLRLIALDADDLAIFSANLQDATIVVADMTFMPKPKRFVMVGKRYDWVKASAGVCERCATGVHFERVLGVARIGFDQAEAERELNLLAIHFTPTDAPAGRIVMTFSGGIAIRLEVECLEARMSDLGARWSCDTPAAHPVAEEA